MSSSLTTTKPKISLTVIDAIYNRRAVRDYLPQEIDQSVIQTLLDAAVHAPTAMQEEPWSFVIIQNENMLNRLSNSVKALIRSESQDDSQQARHGLDLMNNPDFHDFYNASTLIIIYSKFRGQFVVADCWLAAENLMLAAYAKGLGTCVIGSAVSTLNTPEWKAELGISAEMVAIAPMIVGLPAHETPPVSRKEPEILTWIKQDHIQN
jgi:nitroreductase